LLEGVPGNAVYDFGIGERLNTGYPILVQGKPTYFVSAVTPTSAIYSQINGVIFTERIEMFSLLAGTTAAIVVLIIFLIKWSSNLNNEVKRKTRELNESNKQLNTLTEELKKANDSLMASNKQLSVANEQLSHANEQLKLHDKMQKEFINVASHEIKTPTQAILGYSELLQRHPEKREQISDALYRNANRLQRLTNDILDVTRIESQTLKLRKEKFNLADLISNIVEDFKHDIQKKGSDIVLSYPTEDNLVIEADKERITQVISNLLSNAIKFTKQGSISINVLKKTNEDVKNDDSGEEVVVVSVKDTGTGIDSEILPRLFTKFTTKSEVAGGTGLGLFISKSIVEAHGGKMWAQNNNSMDNNREGRGATFYFTLPLMTNNKMQSNNNDNENDNSISRQQSKS
jgi:signal transduction histidine kinase